MHGNMDSFPWVRCCTVEVLLQMLLVLGQMCWWGHQGGRYQKSWKSLDKDVKKCANKNDHWLHRVYNKVGELNAGLGEESQCNRSLDISTTDAMMKAPFRLKTQHVGSSACQNKHKDPIHQSWQMHSFASSCMLIHRCPSTMDRALWI